MAVQENNVCDTTITYKCSIALALDVLGGKWKPLIIWHLKDRTLRFGELKRSLGPVTQKMLTQQLRQLEKDELILRRIHSLTPPNVEYSLTEKGRSVLPVLQQLSKWGAANCR